MVSVQVQYKKSIPKFAMGHADKNHFHLFQHYFSVMSSQTSCAQGCTENGMHQFSHSEVCFTVKDLSSSMGNPQRGQKVKLV